MGFGEYVLIYAEMHNIFTHKHTHTRHGHTHTFYNNVDMMVKVLPGGIRQKEMEHERRV